MKQLVSALWQSTMEKWRKIVWAESAGGPAASRDVAARVQGVRLDGLQTPKEGNWPMHGQGSDEGQNKSASAVVTRYTKENGGWKVLGVRSNGCGGREEAKRNHSN